MPTFTYLLKSFPRFILISAMVLSTNSAFSAANESQELLRYGETRAKAGRLSKENARIYIAIGVGYKEKFTGQQVGESLKKYFWDKRAEKGKTSIIAEYIYDDGKTGASTGISFIVNGLLCAVDLDADGDGIFSFSQLRDNDQAILEDVALTYEAIFLLKESPWYLGQ